MIHTLHERIHQLDPSHFVPDVVEIPAGNSTANANTKGCGVVAAIILGIIFIAVMAYVSAM